MSLIAACAGCVLLAAATAPPQVVKTPENHVFYVVESNANSWTVIDRDQIEVLGSGPMVRAWSIRVVKNILASPPGQPGYVRTLTDYNCPRRLFRWREFSVFARSGDRLVQRQNSTYAWESADKAPDTAAAFQIACGQGGAQRVVTAESAARLVILLMGSWDQPQAPPAASPRSPKPPGDVAKRAEPAPFKDLWR